MILRSLTTQNFRNLAPAAIEFDPRTNIVVGRNGQGKTNLLEAIYFLGTTRSFRTTRIASVFRFDSASLFVSGAVERDGIERVLSAGLESGETRRRVLMLNGEKVTLASYLQALTVFAYSSARLDVIRGVPEDRRRFVDRGVASVHPGFLEQSSRYARALRQRNALLADIATRADSVSSLDAWDEEITLAAEDVQKARGMYLRALQGAFDEIVRRHAYHVDQLKITYKPSLFDQLQKRRREEIRARTTLAGPQRDVVDITIDGRSAAEVLSGGEQKMAVLFLKFAKVELFRRRQDDAPLFLLDDIDAELDLGILQELLQRLPESTQVFATSAKEAFLEVLRTGAHRRLTIENGRVTASGEFA